MEASRRAWKSPPSSTTAGRRRSSGQCLRIGSWSSMWSKDGNLSATFWTCPFQQLPSQTPMTPSTSRSWSRGSGYRHSWRFTSFQPDLSWPVASSEILFWILSSPFSTFEKTLYLLPVCTYFWIFFCNEMFETILLTASMRLLCTKWYL